MEERITKEELLERLFHDDYENLKGRRLRLTRVRVPGKELSFAHVFTPNDRSIYENLALHIGVHEGEDHRGDAIGMVRVTPWEAIVVENAPLGVQAGVAARIFTVAVNTGPLPDRVLLDAGADYLLPDMERLAHRFEDLYIQLNM